MKVSETQLIPGDIIYNPATKEKRIVIWAGNIEIHGVKDQFWPADNFDVSVFNTEGEIDEIYDIKELDNWQVLRNAFNE